MREKEFFWKTENLHWVETSMPMFMIYSWDCHYSFFLQFLQNIQSVTPSEYGSEAKDVIIGMQNRTFPEVNIPSNNLSLINVEIHVCQFSDI